jgi:molecular chaperone DnaJ
MDLYDLLGVRKNASAAEVRRAFQKRARCLHPDLNPGDPVAAARFREVSRAFDVLSDPPSRAAYDRGEPSPTPVSPAAESGFEGFDFSAQVRVERLGFREIFDAERRLPEHPGGGRGEDLEQSTRLTFEESLVGTKRRVHLVRYEPCAACQGAGEVAFGPVPCPRCLGSGQVRGSRGHMIFSRRCAECDARGTLHRRSCPRCAGEGRLATSEWVDVQIPPGVGDGSQVRVPGCGNAGRRSGAAGDFILSIAVDAHPVFRREGEDLHCVVPVTMTEAALGAHVAVPTPDGPVTIELPAGTQNGQRFRLRKRGVPKLGEKGRGDLYVETRVAIPAVTDDRARALLREFSLVHPEDPGRAAGDLKAS